MTSYVVAAHNLYQNGKYQGVIDLYENMRLKEMMDIKYPRDMVTLIAASCYKLVWILFEAILHRLR